MSEDTQRVTFDYIEQSVPLWADISQLTRENDLTTQLLIMVSEMNETYTALLAGDQQEIVDGYVDVWWMAEVVKHLCYGYVSTSYTVDFELAIVKELIDQQYPNLLDLNFEPFKKAVLDSNFSKFCFTAEQLKHELENFEKEGFRVRTVAYPFTLESPESSEPVVTHIYCLRSEIDQVDSKGIYWPKDKVMKIKTYHRPNYKVIPVPKK